MSTSIFVDESKAKNYLMVAVHCDRELLVTARREIAKLVLPGQRGLHMRHESDRRRGQIVDALVRLAPQMRVTVYNAGRDGPERVRRRQCIRALALDATHHTRAMIVFDCDDSLLSWDRQVMIESVRSLGCTDRLRYQHTHRQNEVLLAMPDAIAWCWARGGQWRQRVRPIVAGVQNV